MGQSTTFIRWAGGKSWLVPYIKELLDGFEYNNYYEPFMGGASVFFAIAPPHKSVLSDTNEDLVNAFCAVRDNPKRVIWYLKKMGTDEDSYYQIRKEKPSGKYQRAARFIYLNAYSYNGLYRVNRQGEYNVPYGRRPNYSLDYERIIASSRALQDVQIKCQDFMRERESIQNGDLVFLDPPYRSLTTQKSFIAYNSKLFSIDDQRRLVELIDSIIEAGAYYIMTNDAHKEILDLFHDKGRVVTKNRASLIGGKHAVRGAVQEYIFTNIPEKGENDGKN